MITQNQYHMWVDLLENADAHGIKKFRGGLKSAEGSFCALGVLAHHVLGLKLNKTGGSAHFTEEKLVGFTDILPEEVLPAHVVRHVSTINDDDYSYPANDFRAVIDHLKSISHKIVQP